MAKAARPSRSKQTLLLLGIVLLLALFIHLCYGGSWLKPAEVLRELFRGDQGDTNQNFVVWQLRFPRSLACLCVGAALGAVGASFQSLFRNPLADPYTTGVSGGAAVGGVMAILLRLSVGFGDLSTIVFGFIGGMLSLLLVLSLARRHGVIAVKSLILAGVVVGSMLASLTTLFLYLAGQDTNKVLAWLLGSMTPMFWNRVLILGVNATAGGIILSLQARKLNAFAIGESTALRLGINTGQLKAIVLVVGTAMISICVGAVGMIGFIGLVAPHMARRLLGVDWRVSMPGAILLGPTLLLLADMIAQRAVIVTELPVGSVAAVLGAPFLLVLLRKDTDRV